MRRPRLPRARRSQDWLDNNAISMIFFSDIRDELRGRPYELVHVAGGWQLRTKARYADAVRALNNSARDAGPRN